MFISFSFGLFQIYIGRITRQPLGRKEREGTEFESLVWHCKTQAAELSTSIEKGPPEIQLGKSSRITMSRYSSLT